MKRTKNNWLTPEPVRRKDVSGLRMFDGEDLHFQERKRAFQATQKQWIEEQLFEKQQLRLKEQQEEQMYAFQTRQVGRMRGMLEDQLSKNLRQLQEETKAVNLQLDRERKEREREERRRKLHEEDQDLMAQTELRQVPAYANPL